MGGSDIPTLRRLRLNRLQYDSMRLHVEACLPLEACGLLAGSSGLVQEVIPVTNQARSPIRFRMDPAEQVRAFDRINSSGWDLLAVFHSHPSGPDEPSPTDLAEAAYPVLQVIWSRAGRWKARCFWFGEGRAFEVELHITDE